jgi:hypothetical protein
MIWLVLAALVLGAALYFGGDVKARLRHPAGDALRALGAAAFAALTVFLAIRHAILPSMLAASLVYLLARPLISAYRARVRGEAGAERAQAPRSVQSMTREEALAVLGLGPAPSREDVKHAHRRLMMKLHPDQGGTDYLAAKINRAKEILLDE